MSTRLKYAVVSASSCLTLLLLVGSLLGQSSSNREDTYKHIDVFSDVVAHIKSDYVEEPDMKSVTLGAMNGMLEAIDPFASYLNSDQYRDYLKNKDLKRADVGLALAKLPGYLRVVAALPGSPAARAGFSTGDMIESIGGVATRDMPLAYAYMLLGGEPGSDVTLSAVHVRQIALEPQSVKLIRMNIELPPVDSSMLADGVGYINVDALGAAQVKQVADAVQKLQKDGAKKLIVDLRNCAVGEPQNGIALANLFMNKGLITYLLGQRVVRQNFEADPAKAITTLPVAILTNRGTSSAAEIAAAAIQDSKRGQVVGEPTFGNAAERKPITMEDGGAIILSVAKYYSPKGDSIQDKRVTPATLIASAEPQVDFEEDGAPAAQPPKPAPQPEEDKKTPNDPVVKKALEVLSK
jgi:carboxyl-terminal processing protease